MMHICPYCESRADVLGRPDSTRLICSNWRCQAQAWEGKWYTKAEWDVQTSCGCCLNKDKEACRTCRKFENWKYADMEESVPVADDWWPPAHEKGKLE